MSADEMLEVAGLLYGPFNDTDKHPTLAQVEEMLKAQRTAHDERVTGLLHANNAEVERRRKAEAALAVCRQSLVEQAAARSDPSMPKLRPAVVALLREYAEAAYATATTKEDRIVSHGLALLCEWQERVTSAKPVNEEAR